MKSSETVSKIATALIQAQEQITFAVKDANNPFFKSKYADLPTVIDAVKPALNKAGIAFIQSATPSEPGTLSLTTRLLHSSGEWIEDTATAPLAKNDPQGYGSAITYLRRYSLAAMTGLYQDDDDGNAASQTEKQKKPLLTTDQVAAVNDAVAAAGITIERVCKIAHVSSVKNIEAERFSGLIKWIKEQKKEAA